LQAVGQPRVQELAGAGLGLLQAAVELALDPLYEAARNLGHVETPRGAVEEPRAHSRRSKDWTATCGQAVHFICGWTIRKAFTACEDDRRE
jgi:hypothetical protein